MKWACARKADHKGQENRAAAVQRGDIITTYDPNSMDSSGCYRNVRHYEIQKEGYLKSIDYTEASRKLNMDMQYSSLTKEGMDTGKKLDSTAINNVMSKWIDYGGR